MYSLYLPTVAMIRLSSIIILTLSVAQCYGTYISKIFLGSRIFTVKILKIMFESATFKHGDLVNFLCGLELGIQLHFF